MEWGQQMRNHQTNMLDSTYQNSNYSRERETRKTLIIDSGTINTDTTFSLTLQEPFIIDKLSDVYLESFTTFKALNSGAATQNMGFILDINQFNIQNNSTNKNIFNKIFIPNEDSAGTSTVVHKSKKLNYVCQINPTKLKDITGSITDCQLDSTGSAGFILGSSTGRFIVEFVIIARE